MATRSVEQIQRELAKTDAPAESLLKKQIAAIPGSLKAEEDGLRAKQAEAFNKILGGAKSRGLKFSGIPLAEQARFTSTEFLPAMARLRQSGQDQRFTLQGALADIVRQRGLSAQGLFQQEQDRAAADRRAAAARAAQFDTNALQQRFNELMQKYTALGQQTLGAGFDPNAFTPASLMTPQDERTRTALLNRDGRLPLVDAAGSIKGDLLKFVDDRGVPTVRAQARF